MTLDDQLQKALEKEDYKTAAVLRDKIKYTWYPGKQQSKKQTILVRDECIICSGTGKRIDRRTNKERDCAGCKGTGIMKVERNIKE
jgi:DnaJ-class molecular chaperone